MTDTDITHEDDASRVLTSDTDEDVASLRAALRSKLGTKAGNARLTDEAIDAHMVRLILAGDITSPSGAYITFRKNDIPASRPRVIESFGRILAFMNDEDVTSEDVTSDEDEDDTNDDEDDTSTSDA